MKNFKLLLSITLMLSSVALSTQKAQSQMRTPFEKTEFTEDGKRIYVYPHEHLSKMTVTASYGFQPMNGFDWYNSPRFDSKWSSDVTFPTVADYNTGSYSIGFNIYATPWLEVCVPFIYTYNEGHIITGSSAAAFETSGYRESWLSMMPGVKISWLYNDKWHFYSRVSVGWALGNRFEGTKSVGVSGELNHKFALAWQVSPVGVEFGRRFRIFAEGGFGTSGKIVCGVKLCFGKNPENANDPSRKASNWHDSYL